MFVKTFGDVLHGSVAFIPETLTVHQNIQLEPSALNLNGLTVQFSGKPEVDYNIAAYWHEISKKKHVTAFGVINVSFSVSYLQNKRLDPLNLTYQEFLTLPSDYSSPHGNSNVIKRTSLHKLGNSRPYNARDLTFDFNPEEFYNPESLAALLDHPNIPPLDTDAWYKWTPENSDGIVLPHPLWSDEIV